MLRELVCTDSPLTVAGACGGSHPDSTPDWGEAQAGWGHGPSLGRLGLAGPEQYMVTWLWEAGQVVGRGLQQTDFVSVCFCNTFL